MSRSTFAEVLPIFFEAGLKNIEITMNTSNAGDMIRHANKYFGNKLIIGAGTVYTQNDLKEALHAGAMFISSPVLEKSILTACIQKEIPVIPGAFTPSEIFRAWTAGAAMVKLFPAASLGVQYLKEVKAPLNNIAIMPSGGIDQQNICPFFEAGASAVSIGSKLFDTAMIREKNWNGLVNHFSLFVDAIKSTGNHIASRN